MRENLQQEEWQIHVNHLYLFDIFDAYEVISIEPVNLPRIKLRYPERWHY